MLASFNHNYGIKRKSILLLFGELTGIFCLYHCVLLRSSLKVLNDYNLPKQEGGLELVENK